VQRLCADTAKARELLGFCPQTDLRTGLAQLKAWYEGLDEPPECLLEHEIVRNWEAPDLECSGRALSRPQVGVLESR